MKKITSLLLTFAMLLSCMLLFGCADKKSSAVIGIGGIGPLSGSTSKYGLSVKNGAEIAVEEINALGGVQLELNFKDDADSSGDGIAATRAYDELLDWGMQILLGATTTEPCIQVVEKAYGDRVFTVTPSASAPEITEGRDNVFRVCYNDDGQGKAAADYIAANGLSQRVAVIYKKGDVYSEGVYAAFKTELERLELDIVYTATFTDKDDTDFTSHLEAAEAAGADLLFLPIYYEPAARIITQASEMEYFPLIFGTDGIDGILTADGFDASLAEGVHLLTPIPADYQDDRTRQFMESYQAKYGERATQFAADAYDAVYAIYEAVKSSGVTADMTAEEMCPMLIEAMTKIKLDGITSGDGELTWDDSGEVAKEPIVVVIRDSTYFVK